MAHGFDASLVMLAEFKIKPDRVSEFLNYTIANLAVSRSYPGNIAFDMLIDRANPESIRFYEVWESTEAQQAYMAWRTQAGDLTTLMSFLAEAPKFTALGRVIA